ncbi:MAG: TolB-like translocation protein, partial [Planctomycetota bacterium]
MCTHPQLPKILLALAASLITLAAAIAQTQPQNLWLLSGKGCAASDGSQPVLWPNSNPVVGNPHFRITVSSLPPKGQAFLYLSGQRASIPWGNCTILIDANMAVPLPLQSGAGEAWIQVPIPNDPGLLGATGYLQALIAEANHISLTPRLELAIGQAHREFGSITTLRGAATSALTPIYHDRQGSGTAPDMPASTGLLDIRTTRFPDPSPVLRELADNRVRREQLSPVQRLIALPDLGHLYLSTGGLFLADQETGTLRMIVDAGSGSFPASYVAVSEAGSRVALVRRTGARFAVILAATDGATLSGNRIYVDVTPTTLVAPDPKSLTFVGDRLVFKATLTATTARPDRLFVAPADGSRTAVAATIPALGNLSTVNRIEAPFLSAGDKAAFVGGSGITRSDVYVYDAQSDKVVNVSGFREVSAKVTSLVVNDSVPHAALSDRGQRIAFEANVSNGTRLYVAPTDGSHKGALQPQATSSQVPTTWTYRFPHFVSEGELLVFAGPNMADILRFTFAEGSSTQPIALENLTNTSGQQKPPFTVAGKLRPRQVWTSGTGEVLYAEQQRNDGSRELFAVDMADKQAFSITGNTFNQSNVPPLKGIHQIVRSSQNDTEPTLMVAATTEGNILMSWDGERPDLGVRVLTGVPAQTEIRDVLMTADLTAGYFVELAGGSTPISATSVIRRFDWITGKISQEARVTGVISEGSLCLLHELDATLLYALGNNSSRVPTNARLFHTSVRSNIRHTVDMVAGMHILLAAAPVAAVAAGKCKWSGTVSKRCVCVGQNSILTVKIRKGSSPNETIEVAIKGNGPTFANGKKTTTVPCKRGTYKLAIKANNKPGCYDVCLGGKVKAK